ncbi:SRPBCC domain-containing protein [Nonomuraea sp. SYSU D8015]|uniref:SRPBCC domain-containing protein n=1 Tax=Nonomuraea sp. SYSU D8015 TaxID=2593644 RepID=UPI001660492A|nr:SRPBCC domain-containing protein [Nonomuraea sp. SYSU D8015]
MTRQNLGDETTTMTAEGDELLMERVFDAPREAVWAAMTTPEHIPHWWGPRGSTTEVVEMDVRPGGRWRWINKFETGEAPYKGEYLEVVPPERLVRTSLFDVGPEGPPAIETISLEDLGGGKTRLRHHARFPSEDVLAFAISQGMAKGVLEQLDRLAELAATLA